MSLSEQELRALREIEQSLLADDPKFGASVSGALGDSTAVFSLRTVAIFVLGLVTLIGGIALSQTNMWFVALSVVGFLLMLGAGIWTLRAGDAFPSGWQAPRAARTARGKSSGFTNRMDERFRSRFEDGN